MAEHLSQDPAAASIQDEADVPEFLYEGFFTHWVCPECGWNDSSEGDTRCQDIECPNCGLKGRIPS